MTTMLTFGAFEPQLLVPSSSAIHFSQKFFSAAFCSAKSSMMTLKVNMKNHYFFKVVPVHNVNVHPNEYVRDKYGESRTEDTAEIHNFNLK